ncbi:MAG TPA: trypsin-like peptidase domain-containing protein [Dermatophilaceae bacterium]|nr:trypsin-like peptidase domain-containing protein [Dermatophilaceae bacterium]
MTHDPHAGLGPDGRPAAPASPPAEPGAPQPGSPQPGAPQPGAPQLGSPQLGAPQPGSPAPVAPPQAADTQPVWYQQAPGHPGAPPPPLGQPAYQPYGGAPTAAFPAPPGAQGPDGPGQPGSPPGPAGSGSGSGGRGGRRLAETGAVALLAALLASGATYAATNLGEDSASPAGATGSSSQLGASQPGPVKQADADNPSWTATAASVAPSVVSISVEAEQGSGQGSGVVIDDKGHVVTNNHVVSAGAGGGTLTVTLYDGRAYDATIVGTDPSTDLAVLLLKNPPKDLKPIAFGNSDEVRVGDPVMAVGNPLGLAGTVTTGIVSALNRPVSTSAEDSSGTPGQSTEPVVTNAIQTSAAINPGNSGGALVNGSGQLIGINSSIATLGSTGGTGGASGGNIGIGFAIPVNETRTIASQLIEDGTAEHAYLGVTPRDGTASDGSSKRAGAEITSVAPGTPAAEAGLRNGDVVIAVDGQRVDSALSLVANIRQRSVGDEVELTVLRDGKEQTLTATLTARPKS